MSQLDITREGLATFLSEEWGEPVEIRELRASSVGARRRNLLFDAHRRSGTTGLVATIVPPDSMPGLDVVDEAAVIHLAASGGVLAPGVHGVCRDERFVGAPFFLTSRIDGETLPRGVLRLAEATPAFGARLAGQCGEALARLHALNAETAPAKLLRARADDTAGLAIQMIESLLDVLLQPSPAFLLGYRWLERHRPDPPSHSVLLHGDFRNGNLVVDKDGLRGILDWEVSHIGDSMEDPAWMCVRMWRFGNDTQEVGGFAGRADLRAGYEAQGGEWDEERFHWWKVLGTLKWGLVLAIQAASYLRGATGSIVMAASGRRVAELEYDTLMLTHEGEAP